MKVRPASSGRTIYEAMEHVRDVYSWSELLELVDKEFDFWKPDRNNVTMEWYAHDERIGWDTWLVCVDGKAALFTDSLLEDMPISNVLPAKQ